LPTNSRNLRLYSLSNEVDLLTTSISFCENIFPIPTV
jgi:hypothetical protein